MFIYDLTEARYCLATYYAGRLRVADELLERGGARSVEGVAILRAEFPHIVSAMNWALDSAKDSKDPAVVDMCVDFMKRGSNLLEVIQNPLEQLKWLMDLASLLRALSRYDQEEAALREVAEKHTILGDTKQAIIELNRALASAETRQDSVSQADTLYSLGWAYYSTGFPSRAITLFEDSLERIEGTELPRLRARILTAAGLAHQDLSEYATALERHRTALDLARNAGSLAIEANILNNMAMVENDLEKPRRAIPLLRRALSIHRSLGNRNNEANILVNTGLAYANLEKWKRAISCYRAALKIMTEIGSVRNQGRVLGNIGVAFRALGLPHKALRFHRRAFVCSRKANDETEMLQHLLRQGWIHEASEDFEKAIAIYSTYCEMAGLQHRPHQLGIGLRNLGDAYFLSRRTNECIEAYERSLTVDTQSQEYRTTKGKVLYRVGLLYTRLGRVSRGLDFLVRAERAARRTEDLQTCRRVLRRRGDIYFGLGLHRRCAACQVREIDVVRKMMAGTKDGRVLSTLGDAYRDQGRYLDALSIHDQAARMAPEDPEIEYGRGLIFRCLGMLPEAKVAFEKAVSLRPDSVAYKIAFTKVVMSLGQESEAGGLFDDTEAQIGALSRYNRACLAASREQMDDAIRFIEEAMWREEVSIGWALRDPDLAGLRREARFIKMIATERGRKM